LEGSDVVLLLVAHGFETTEKPIVVILDSCAIAPRGNPRQVLAGIELRIHEIGVEANIDLTGTYGCQPREYFSLEAREGRIALPEREDRQLAGRVLDACMREVDEV